MTTNLTLAKGSYSVTLQTVEIQDNYDNAIRPIIIPTTAQNQANGPTDNKIIDLLRISHTIQVRAYLTSSTQRDDIISMFKGADVEGQPATLTYDTYPNSPLYVYIEKLIITEKAEDNSTANQKKYDIQITLLEGVKA